MRAFRNWMKTRQHKDRIAYMGYRNACELTKRKTKDDVRIKTGKDLVEDSRGTKKLLYSVTKNYRKGFNETSSPIKDKGGNVMVEPEEIAERWSEYFENF